MNKIFRISVPHRTSISVIDMNTFSPGIPGGGNIGFAIDLRTEIEIKIAKKKKVIFNDLPLRRRNELLHLMDYILRYTKTDNNFEINISTLKQSHIGLASNTAFQLCFLIGLNLINKYNFDNSTISREIIDNYIEFEDTKLVKGFTTGLSAFLNLHGGFAIVNPNLELIFHQRMHSWRYLFVIKKDIITKSFGDIELKTLMGSGREADSKTLNKKWEIIDNGLIPAIKTSNLIDFGYYVKRIQEIGSKKEEINIYGKSLRNVLNDFYNLGIECSFLSALGPGIVILSRKPLMFLEKCMDKIGYEIMYTGQVDNDGLKINQTYSP